MTKTNSSNMKEFFNNWANKWDDYSHGDCKLISKYISLLGIGEKDKILDVACGTGVVTEILSNSTASEIHAVDISEKMIELARQKINSRRVEFYAADFLDGCFSGFNSMIMYNALPHFMDRNKFAECVSDAVKKDGKVLICHGVGKDKINSCHKGVMNISSKLHSPQAEYAHFKHAFRLLDCVDKEDEYYLLMEKI